MTYPGVTDSICVVTGAAQGIGEAIARTLAASGASVALVDSNEERVIEVAAEIRDASSRGVIAIPADVRDAAAVDDAIARIELELGPIDALINVAGILRAGPVATYDAADFIATFDVNVRGVFIVSRAVARHMIPRRSGTIITIGSNSARVPRMNMAAYAASKAASAMLTKCLGLELGEYGIRCNVVSPGSTDTPMQRAFWTEACGREGVIAGSLEAFRVGIPLKKLAQPVDVANAVLFLISDHASHVTMQDLLVDGGASLGI